MDGIIACLDLCPRFLIYLFIFLVFLLANHHGLLLIVISTLQDARIMHLFYSVFLLTLWYYHSVIAPCLKLYCRVTYLSAIPTYLLLVVEISNPLNCTSVQFTIVVLTWNYFTSYDRVLSMSFSARVFWSGCTCFRCKLFSLFLKQHIRQIYRLIYLYLFPHDPDHSISWLETLVVNNF